MALSSFTYIPEIPNRSEATPGLWNRIFSIISSNLDQLNNDAAVGSSATAQTAIGFSTNTLKPESGTTLRVFNDRVLVARSIDSGGRVFDARNYGFVGDNATDDYPAIQSAIFAAEASADVMGGACEVYIPAGDARLSSGLTLAPTTTYTIRIRGAGKRSTFLRPLASAVTALSVGTAGSSTMYGEIADLTITGANVSSKTGAALHLIRPQRWVVRDVNIEEFDGTDAAGLYLEGSPTAAAPHAWRGAFERVLVATTRRPLVMVNADENDFWNCNFGCVTGQDSRCTAIELRQGRNNRFVGLLVQGETSSITTGRTNYVGIHLASPAQGDNSHNVFIGTVAEGFDAGFLLESNASRTLIFGYNGSINSSHVSDGGTDTVFIAPQHNSFLWPSGSTSLPSLAFSAESKLGWFRSGASQVELSQGVLLVPQSPGGTTAALGFSGDTNTGLSWAGADLGNFVAGGQLAGRWGNAFLGIVGGSAIAPSLRFTSDLSLGLYRSGVSTIAQSFGTLNLATGGVRLSMRTLAASAVTASAALTNVAVNEVVFTVGGASGASLAIMSGGTLYYFNSAGSAAAA